MAFTAKLGEILSSLANILLGKGAVAHPVATSINATTGVPTLSVNTSYVAPRYPQVQKTSAVTTAGGTSAASFSTLPTTGNFILVLAGSGIDPSNPSCADNQGNTYIRAVKSSSSFTGSASVFYAYNIGAPSGTFTVTVTDAGSAAVTLIALEYSGFGTLNPLYTTGTSGLQFNQTTPQGAIATVNPNALGASVVRTQLTGIPTPSAKTPPWVQVLGQSSTSGAVRKIEAAGLQNITWNNGNNMNACIAIFQDPADFSGMRATQQVQSILSQQVATVRATQLVQSVTTSVDAVATRVTQILMTLITTAPPVDIPPDTAPPGSFLLRSARQHWGLERFDIKTRDEEIN